MAAKNLRQALGHVEAIVAIERAFADPWGAKNATIRTIAGNPAKWVGPAVPAPVSDDDGFPRGRPPPPPRALTIDEIEALGRPPGWKPVMETTFDRGASCPHGIAQNTICIECEGA